MLVDNKHNLYGVYWTTGISSILMGIYEYDTRNRDFNISTNILNQFADDNGFNGCNDFTDYIENRVEEIYGDELSNCENADEWNKQFNEYFEIVVSEFSVQPIDIEIKKGE